MHLVAAGVIVALLALPSVAYADGSSALVLNGPDFVLEGGASLVSGHGAPTGLALRSGSPGQITAASFPSKLVLAPDATLSAIELSYQYITGYGPSGIGSNLSLSVTKDALPSTETLLYSSPEYTDHSYAANSSNYSKPVKVSLSGLSVTASSSRLQFVFTNNDRNLQILLPLRVNITCTGASQCLIAPPPPPPPLPPLPPTPPPPVTGTPWKAIGPTNIGDSITPDGGESGTLQPVVAARASPDGCWERDRDPQLRCVVYTGGNNNAASSGVLKSTDFGNHWSKVNTGLTDTRIHGLYIVDDEGEHVMVGTPSGVFETLNGGASWVHVTQTQGWGVANTFRNGTINGKPFLFVGTNAGLGNVPLLQSPLVNQTWNLIVSPPGHAAWRTNPVSISDYRAGALLPSSVVGGCLWVGGHGVVHIGTVLNETAMDWTFQLDQPCQSMAMDPNDANHFLVNNASNGAHIYESTDAGQSYHSCLNYRGAVMVSIDRTGWFYVGSEAGAYRNAGGCISGKWEPYFDRRVARRTGTIRDKVPHDFQGINIDFGGRPGGVAFGSDQGMFIKNLNNLTDLRFISGNGDMNNNIIMHPAIAEGEEPNTVYIVTAMWDWAPVASWDNGSHWPSWQTPDDGAGISFIGEGGGCFGVGKSKNSLCIHHHNVAYSSRGGKNFSRFVIPHGGSAGGSEFARKPGSRSEPSGPVYIAMTMGMPPWDTLPDKEIVCNGTETQADLGVHTSYSCLSHVDIGLEYNWFPGVNAAIWRGSTDKHCILCKLSGPTSSWKTTDITGTMSYALQQGAKIKTIEDYEQRKDGPNDDEGPGDDDDDWKKKMEKQRLMEYNQTCSEWNAVMPHLAFAGRSQMAAEAIESGAGAAGAKYVLKSWNFGANWTWILMPSYLQGVGGFQADPTNETLYAVVSNCISRSYDQAETWDGCWEAPGLVGSFKELIIKDSKTMLVMRNGDVPLRTKDGGASWQRLGSLENVAKYSPTASYSWSGKTLALSGISGKVFVWVSNDDGDTWKDETGDYSSMSGGLAQWYDNTLYISSLGQGISAKTFDEPELDLDSRD